MALWWHDELRRNESLLYTGLGRINCFKAGQLRGRDRTSASSPRRIQSDKPPFNRPSAARLPHPAFPPHCFFPDLAMQVEMQVFMPAAFVFQGLVFLPWYFFMHCESHFI